ncbi:MAG TPA: hypothetical protein VGE41_09690 [Verrucomicrobiae bacterium]
MALALLLGPKVLATPGAPPLPPSKAVLEKLIENAPRDSEHERAFREQYSYLRTRLFQELNGKGQVTKQNKSKVTVIPPPKASATAQTHSSQTSTNQKNFKTDDFPISHELLDRFEFKVAGRENLNGRAALLLEFQPAHKKLPSHGLKEKFLNKIGGRVWIDEAESVLAKVDVHLVDTVSIAAGIAGAVKQFQFHFERSRTNEGIWYTKNIDWSVDAREFLAQKHFHSEERKENVTRVK